MDVITTTPTLPAPKCGGLIELDVSDTGVSPAALLDALRVLAAAPTTKVHLTRLMAASTSGGARTSGGGDDDECQQVWMPHQLDDLADLLDVALLKETDVGILETSSSSCESQQLLPSVERLACSGVRSH